MVDAAMWGAAAGDAPASSPGPLLEVQAARRLRIRWHNALPASAFPEVPGKPAAQLPLVTAVVTSADDSATVQNRLGAMNGTRFHVQAGLAGGYLVRDPREAELGLPTCAADGEIHLLLADRNVDVDEAGEVRLLHKTTPDTAEFFRPLTLVDGRVWPRLAARPEVLRLRRWPGGLVSASRIVRCSWPHPIHIHQAQFQPLSPSAGVVAVQAGEEPNKVNHYDPSYRRTLLPIVPPPPDQPSTGRHYEPQETGGWKDMIRVDPGEVVSVAVRFDLAGRYVYHCHVLEHEDTEMMRPILVTPVRMATDMPGM